jgi:peptidoglycan-associated lipoprotein
MAYCLSLPFYGFLFFALFTWIGCSPSATKPEGGSVPSGKDQAVAPKGKPSEVARESAPRSSLEAFQAGKPAAEGPLKEIFFDYDRYDLRPDARETLKANVAWLKSNPSARVEIEGHCDERGTNEYNLALGAKRAQSAKDYLVTLGISAQRLSTISYGKELPMCREQTEGCWQKNRRDRFTVHSGKPTS